MPSRGGLGRAEDAVPDIEGVRAGEVGADQYAISAATGDCAASIPIAMLLQKVMVGGRDDGDDDWPAGHFVLGRGKWWRAVRPLWRCLVRRIYCFTR